MPTQPDPLEGCEIEPPSCSIAPDGGADRVVVCIEFGRTQAELCILLANVQIMLDLGMRHGFLFCSELEEELIWSS